MRDGTGDRFTATLPKSDLIGLSAHQRRVDSLPIGGTYFRNLVRPQEPVVTTVRAGNVVIETITDTERDFAHTCSFPGWRNASRREGGVLALFDLTLAAGSCLL